MTVKELIEELKKFDENLIVVYETQEDTYEPSPGIRKFTFDSSYYTGKSFITIEAGQEFIIL